MRPFPQLAVVLLLFLFTTNPVLASNDASGQSSRAGELSVTPDSHGFGKVDVGATVTKSVTLTASNGSVTIRSVKSNNSQFVVTGLTPPVKLDSGERLAVTIQFTPTARGSITGQVEFLSNARDSPTVEKLAGDGVNPSSHSVYLSWQAGSPQAAGYNVYRGTVHGGPYSKLNSRLLSPTDYTDTDVSDGTTYYYVSTEVNDQGEESPYSNETKAQIPSN